VPRKEEASRDLLARPTRGRLADVDVRALERGETPASTYVAPRHAELADEGSIDFQ
jgi:hypothetical protein